MTNGRHFPAALQLRLTEYHISQLRRDSLQNTNNPWFGFMEDEVVDLVISMDGCAPVLWLQLLVPEKCQHLLYVRYLPNGHFRININCCSLRFGNRRESFDLAIVKAGRLAVVFQSNVSRIDPVELGQSSNSIMPPATSISSRSNSSRCATPTFPSFRKVSHQAWWDLQ